ncbi:hypothetical protein [Pseudomonas sp. 28 E 9]|uniref:hypothetical protein n=1 Tax=Pseudomonas sp. 28 E 9 TaxID=1844098 RepID=UPI00081214E8|nr:hypothetical protein [Pseudomonas sp. 28 E 9]CRM60784.1 hypothetical protein [Pseudomonas sp. 28 E 9]
MLAKNLQAQRSFRKHALLLTFFASKLAPTDGDAPTLTTMRSEPLLILILGAPVKPRWPNAGLNPWATRQDAGLAALGHGWPIAAAHGFKPERGHTEPKRGAEWWGKSVLLTFALFKSEPL